MGVVYKARDPLIDRLVALKTVGVEQSGADALAFRLDAPTYSRIAACRSSLVSRYTAVWPACAACSSSARISACDRPRRR